MRERAMVIGDCMYSYVEKAGRSITSVSIGFTSWRGS
jgi:hypothetical protein